jgi:hypothetical protein
MDAAAWVAIAGIVVVVVTGVIGFLLARQIAQQEKFIEDLYAKNKESAKSIVDMQRDLDRNYHPKPEIQILFRDQKIHFDERFDRLERAMGMDRRGMGGDQ